MYVVNQTTHTCPEPQQLNRTVQIFFMNCFIPSSNAFDRKIRKQQSNEHKLHLMFGDGMSRQTEESRETTAPDFKYTV